MFGQVLLLDKANISSKHSISTAQGAAVRVTREEETRRDLIHQVL